MQLQNFLTNKNAHFLCAFLVINYLSIGLFAQNPTTIWAKTFGGSSTEYPYSVVVTKDNKYVVAGWTNSFDGDVDTVNRYLSSSGWLIKLDEEGKLIWKKNYGGNKGDVFSSIFQTSDDGFILVGGTNSIDGDLKNTSGKHGWVLKIDSLGVVQWSKTYGGSGGDAFTSVFQNKNGDYFIGAYSNSTDGDFDENAGKYDIWILKLNTKGDLIWKKRIGGSEDDILKQLTNIDDKTFAFVGVSQSKDGNFLYETKGNYGDYIIKMDSSGKIIWNVTPIGTRLLSRELHSVSMSGQNIVSAGMEIVGQLGVSTQYPYSWNFKVTKTDTSGNDIWTKLYGGLQTDAANSVNVFPNGDLLISGLTQSNNSGDVRNNHSLANATDFWVIRIDSIGKLKNATCYGGFNNDEALSSTIDKKGNVIIVGFSESNNGTFSENKGGIDWGVIKIVYNLLNIVETSNGYVDISEFPNPIENSLTIRISNGFEPSVRLTNITGKIYFNSERIKNETSIDMSQYPSGFYFITYQIDNQLTTKKIVKM